MLLIDQYWTMFCTFWIAHHFIFIVLKVHSLLCSPFYLVYVCLQWNMLQFYPFFVWWAFHDCLMCYLLFIVLLVWRSDSIWIALTLWVILIFYVLVNNLIVLVCLLVMQIPLNYFLKGVLNVPKYISLLLVYNCSFAYLIEHFLRFFAKYGTWRSQIWILEWCFLMLSKSLDLMFLGQALIFFSAHV